MKSNFKCRFFPAIKDNQCFFVCYSHAGLGTLSHINDFARAAARHYFCLIILSCQNIMGINEIITLSVIIV